MRQSPAWVSRRMRSSACATSPSKVSTPSEWPRSGSARSVSPGVLKTLVRLSKEDGVSMGEMARAIGCDPSYVTALVDDLDDRGLARREPAPYDRRVKTVVLTDAGRALAAEINGVLSVPPAAFSSLSNAELRQLRDLLDKVIEAGSAPGAGAGAAGRRPRGAGAVAPQAGRARVKTEVGAAAE